MHASSSSTAPATTSDSPQSRNERGTGPGLLRHRSVRLAIAGWIVAHLVTLLIARGTLPFDRPLLEGTSFAAQITAVDLAMLEVLALIALVVRLTRHHAPPRIVERLRLPMGTDVAHDVRLLIAYGALALLGGIALGQALNMDPISFHLAGTLFGSHDHGLASRMATFTWAGYNLVAYVALPLLIVGRRFAHDARLDALLLRSRDRRNDRLVIGVVLAVESAFQLTALSGAITALSPAQLLIGAPLTFALYGIGTVLPTMIFVQALLVPRYLAITRSVPATVILGGLTYAALHLPEAWMTLTSPGNATLALLFVVFVYAGPGMVKATITVRTGNAWAHAWAYHALAPHTLIDTPLIVRIFGIG